jgi:hypothetical protein
MLWAPRVNCAVEGSLTMLGLTEQSARYIINDMMLRFTVLW